jgi:hypothetical protein
MQRAMITDTRLDVLSRQDPSRNDCALVAQPCSAAGLTDVIYRASRRGCPCRISEVAGHGKETGGHLKTNERWVQDLPVCHSSEAVLLLY